MEEQDSFSSDGFTGDADGLDRCRKSAYGREAPRGSRADRLAEKDARKAQVVEMRFFGGMEFTEVAENLDISVVTAKRDWEFARAWLFQHLKEVQSDAG